MNGLLQKHQPLGFILTVPSPSPPHIFSSAHNEADWHLRIKRLMKAVGFGCCWTITQSRMNGIGFQYLTGYWDSLCKMNGGSSLWVTRCCLKDSRRLLSMEMEVTAWKSCLNVTQLQRPAPCPVCIWDVNWVFDSWIHLFKSHHRHGPFPLINHSESTFDNSSKHSLSTLNVINRFFSSQSL